MEMSGQIHEGTALCGSGAALDGFWRTEKVSGFEPRTTQPLAIRYTNYDNPAAAGHGVYCEKKRRPVRKTDNLTTFMCRLS
jgi:hypothetical protein